MTLEGKNVLIGISGGIAAYKAVVLVRRLQDAGASVRVTMTDAAKRFLSPITFEGITAEPVFSDIWDTSKGGEPHVELAAWADLAIVAPATMNTIAKLANGIVNDALSAAFHCADCPTIVAPAMHHRMWKSSANLHNIETLRARGVEIVGPAEGRLASGDMGLGRLVEPEDIIAVAQSLAATKTLTDLKVLITAGPTHEDLDPVRFIGNRSTGKMGYAICKEFVRRGANVTLISGPVSLPSPLNANVIQVRSADEMYAAAMSAEFDVAIMTAAVADYRPAEKSANKIKKSEEMSLRLVRNPDILKSLGDKKQNEQTLVGFALESERLLEYARGKLGKKNADLIIANEANVALGQDTNRVVFVEPHTEKEHPLQSKQAVAVELVKWIENRIAKNS